jgi:hypothetical protein
LEVSKCCQYTSCDKRASASELFADILRLTLLLLNLINKNRKNQKNIKSNFFILKDFPMEIVNEIKVKESKDKDDKKDKQKFVARNMAEVQRAKLEKLMKNPVNPN